MSLIKDFVKELRDYAIYLEDDLGTGKTCDLLRKAADTIEELSAKVARQNMERSSQYYGGGWISADEKLPEDSLNVLVTVKAMVNGGTHDGEYIKIIGIGRYSNFFRKWELYTGYSIKDYGVKVLAWQPLPPAYEPKEDKDETD